MPSARWQPTLLIRASIALHGLALLAVIAEPGQWHWALGAVLANHALLALLGLWPRSHWLGSNWTRLPAAATARNEIALTIDDGPDPVVTPRVLDLLDRYATHATFFCIGEKAARYPDLCRDIVSRGHAIENHSQHHRHHFSLMGRSGIARELQAAQDTLTTITGQRPLFFRAPAGLRNPFLDPVLARLGLQLASWSARGFDTRIGDAERINNKLLRGMRAGAILLLHDGNAARTSDGTPVILEVIPTVMASAAAANLRFVTLRHALS
ncbi:polysaccharide deacetylase family protein [Rhodoferax sp. UBA5149]|uniref:polysaccharide deacetylase family protein n=1 Tax=Rhodoferax sp. UBA5149 TaxID=1947379 RepID=UPI0025E5ECD4|nr:polysaccharide deacetylase family protein [Rhodoferax sp. UBA5149]